MKIVASLAAMCPSVQRRQRQLPFLLPQRLRLQWLALPLLSLPRLLLLRAQLRLHLLPLPFNLPRNRLSKWRASLRRRLPPPLHPLPRKLHRLSQSLPPRQQRRRPKHRCLRKHLRSPPRRKATKSSR